MADIIEGINPTRMELLNLRRRVDLAQKGHKLLKEKRDALIAEFLDIVDEVKDARKNAESNLEIAYENLVMAQAVMGVDSVRQVSLVTDQDIDVQLDTRNIMGVRVPIVEFETVTRRASDRGYGFADTSVMVDEAAKSFEDALELVIKLAEIEQTVRSLASEVEKTKRRVNALEYIIIPRLEATAKYIRMRLEEMERENFSRLKKIKAALEEKAEA